MNGVIRPLAIEGPAVLIVGCCYKERTVRSRGYEAIVEHRKTIKFQRGRSDLRSNTQKVVLVKIISQSTGMICQSSVCNSRHLRLVLRDPYQSISLI